MEMTKTSRLEKTEQPYYERSRAEGKKGQPRNRLDTIIWKVLAADKEEGELISASITD